MHIPVTHLSPGSFAAHELVDSLRRVPDHTISLRQPAIGHFTTSRFEFPTSTRLSPRSAGLRESARTSRPSSSSLLLDSLVRIPMIGWLNYGPNEGELLARALEGEQVNSTTKQGGSGGSSGPYVSNHYGTKAWPRPPSPLPFLGCGDHRWPPNPRNRHAVRQQLRACVTGFEASVCLAPR